MCLSLVIITDAAVAAAVVARGEQSQWSLKRDASSIVAAIKRELLLLILNNIYSLISSD